jgi:hypothetical protein
MSLIGYTNQEGEEVLMDLEEVCERLRLLAKLADQHKTDGLDGGGAELYWLGAERTYILCRSMLEEKMFSL